MYLKERQKPRKPSHHPQQNEKNDGGALKRKQDKIEVTDEENYLSSSSADNKTLDRTALIALSVDKELREKYKNASKTERRLDFGGQIYLVKPYKTDGTLNIVYSHYCKKTLG